jgi:DNA-binding beta-propeller fold protein YncE
VVVGVLLVFCVWGAPRALAAPAFGPVAGSPFGTGRGPESVAFSPNGDLLATANRRDDSVSVFAVGSGGALTPVAGSPFQTSIGPGSVAFSPGGGLLAPANLYGHSVSVFAVGAGGTLTAVAGPFRTGLYPVATPRGAGREGAVGPRPSA